MKSVVPANLKSESDFPSQQIQVGGAAEFPVFAGFVVYWTIFR